MRTISPTFFFCTAKKLSRTAAFPIFHRGPEIFFFWGFHFLFFFLLFLNWLRTGSAYGGLVNGSGSSAFSMRPLLAEPSNPPCP